jgi:hypothetical protein
VKLVGTTISEAAIQVRYADQGDPSKAEEWMDFRLKLTNVENPSGMPIGDPALQYLEELQRAVLQYVQTAVGAEIQRLRALANQRP